MASGLVLTERDGPILTVTLNRPERRNALSLDLMRELSAALKDAASTPDVRSIVLAAAGKVFCSGHDLAEMQRRDAADYRHIFDVCTELMERIQQIPQPVIARVQGMATAAGCQLVASCDLAIASTEASFATPGVKIGLFCSTLMVALTRAIGRKRRAGDASDREGDRYAATAAMNGAWSIEAMPRACRSRKCDKNLGL